MTNRPIHRVIPLASTVVTLVAMACDNSVEPKPEFAVFPVAVVLQEGMKTSVRVMTPSPDTALVRQVTWSTSAPSIATVDQTGNIVAVMPGVASISARVGTSSESTTVTVRRRDGLLTSTIGSTCAVTTAGAGICWGTDFIPTLRSSDAVSFALSNYTACFIKSSGATSCSGNNFFGELGAGFTGSFSVQPLQVAGDNHFLAVYAGGTNDDLASQCLDALCGYETCAITDDGSPYCWGYDAVTGAFPAASYPRPLKGVLNFQSIGIGAMYICGVSVDKTLECAGNNRYGQLGSGGHGVDRLSFNMTSLIYRIPFESVSAGSTHVCAIADDGKAYCWGANDSGQLGAPSNESCRLAKVTVACRGSPVEVVGGYRFKSISAGQSTTDNDARHVSHTCGITKDDSLVCWGSNAFGQLGNGTQIDSPSPVPVSGGLKFRSVSAARSYTCAVTIAGQPMCWGVRAGMAPALVPQPLPGGYVLM